MVYTVLRIDFTHASLSFPWLHGLLTRLGRESEKTLADRTLAKRIADTLGHLDLPSVENVSVYVKDGSASLFGLTASESDRLFLGEAVARIAGVRRVEDHMQVVDRKELAAFEHA